MPKVGIQSALVTNWKPALARSKFVHSGIESAKVASEVHSAAWRALRATTASSRSRTIMMNPAPTSGRNVTRESHQLGMTALTPPGR
jgi:hypothetical protein